MGNDSVRARARARVTVNVDVGGKKSAVSQMPPDDFVPLPARRPETEPLLQYMEPSPIQQYGKGLIGAVVPVGSRQAKEIGVTQKPEELYGAEVYSPQELGGPTIAIRSGLSPLRQRETFSHEAGHAAAEELLGRVGLQGQQRDFDIEEVRARLQDVTNVRKIPEEKNTIESLTLYNDALNYIGEVSRRSGRKVSDLISDAVKRDEEIARRVEQRTGKRTISELSGITGRAADEDVSEKPESKREDRGDNE
jgi:hypothetical protein